MTSKFAIVYAKYSMAINTDTVDNKLRDEFCKLFNEEPENEKQRRNHIGPYQHGSGIFFYLVSFLCTDFLADDY